MFLFITLMQLLNPEKLLDLYSIHRRTAGASFAEINEEMSDLLDNLKINIPRLTQALIRGCDENKELEEKNNCCIKNFAMGLYKAVLED